MMTRWRIETSHMVDIPTHYDAADLDDLMRQMQATADRKKARSDRPPIGQLTFHVDWDGDVPAFVRAKFIDRHGQPRRFMRAAAEVSYASAA